MEIEALLSSYVRILGQGALVVYAYSWAVRAFESSRFRDILIGVLFGVAGMVSMADPVELRSGIIFDSRAIVLIISPIYAGGIGTAVAATMMIVHRLAIGGEGAEGGAVATIVVALVGYVLTQISAGRFRYPWRRAIIYGLMTLSSFSALLFVPPSTAQDILQTSAVPIMIANVVGVMLLSDLLYREKYRVRLFRALENEVSVDPLTKLRNRRFLQKVGDCCAERSATNGTPFSVIMLDVDHFKRINDTWGHSVGDIALSDMADVIRSNVRVTDTVARFGGEEIVIVLPDTTKKNAFVVAEKIRQSIAEMVVKVEGGNIGITVSIGIAGSEDGVPDFGGTLKVADKALYGAKNAGRNQIIVSTVEA